MMRMITLPCLNQIRIVGKHNFALKIIVGKLMTESLISILGCQKCAALNIQFDRYFNCCFDNSTSFRKSLGYPIKLHLKSYPNCGGQFFFFFQKTYSMPRLPPQFSQEDYLNDCISSLFLIVFCFAGRSISAVLTAILLLRHSFLSKRSIIVDIHQTFLFDNQIDCSFIQ